MTASRFESSPAVLDRLGVRPGPAPAPDRRLAALLARLSPLEREALRRVEVEGASYDEVAAGMCLARREVAALVFTSRRKLYEGIGRG